MMDATEYQKLAARTLIHAPDFPVSEQQIMVVWNAIGLAGEAGEVAETIKKGIFHQHGLEPEKLRKELGDVLWYVAGLCTTLGIDLGEVMAENIEKLKARYPNGFNSTDSQRRIDTAESTKQPSEFEAYWMGKRVEVIDVEHEHIWRDGTVIFVVEPNSDAEMIEVKLDAIDTPVYFFPHEVRIIGDEG